MLNYWRGLMSWPYPGSWRCDICGEPGYRLVWGMAHGECRCDGCHARYDMGAVEAKNTEPELNMKPKYIKAAKMLWQRYRLPLDTYTDAQWEASLADEKE